MSRAYADLHDLDDVPLLQAHIDGDPDAFGVLVARHQDRLWSVAVRTTSDPELAAEAVQDAVVKAFRSADRFRGDSAVTTWLHRIVVNASLDLLRRRKARPATPYGDDDRGEALAQQGEAVGGAVGGSSGSSGDPALDQERRTDVLAALRTLPDDQRAALVLVDMEGYSVAEAAELLDCAVGTVKSRCSRGRTRLAPLLSAYDPGADPDDDPARTGPERREGTDDGARPDSPRTARNRGPGGRVPTLDDRPTTPTPPTGGEPRA